MRNLFNWPALERIIRILRGDFQSMHLQVISIIIIQITINQEINMMIMNHHNIVIPNAL